MDHDRNLILIATALREFANTRLAHGQTEEVLDRGMEALILAEKVERQRFAETGPRDWFPAIVVSAAIAVVALSFWRF